MGLVAQAFFVVRGGVLRAPELIRTGCRVVDFEMPKMNGLDLHNICLDWAKRFHHKLLTPTELICCRAPLFNLGSFSILPSRSNEVIS